LPDGWFSARPRDRLRLRERRLLDERFLLLDRLRSFLRRERLRLLLRERLADLSSSFSALLERERLLLFETEEASESSSRAIFFAWCVAATASTASARLGGYVCIMHPARNVCPLAHAVLLETATGDLLANRYLLRSVVDSHSWRQSVAAKWASAVRH
jgi:hypothetical protein